MQDFRLAFLAFALILALAPAARADDTIRIWRVGSPHTGDTPKPTVPPGLEQEWNALGFHVTVETFRAAGFAATFFEAVTRNAAPDVLVFDNFGVMNGITTDLGHFDGIGEDPTFRQHFTKVTRAFDLLLGPTRGWTYLFALSPNHSAAKALALQPPRCPNRFDGPPPSRELDDILPTIATAYIEANAIGVQAYSDPARLQTPQPRRETLKVRAVRTCSVQGNNTLAVASVDATYESENALGHTLVLLVLRNLSSRWQLLVAARDPISNDQFVNEARGVAARLSAETAGRSFPIPATLLAPANGNHPRPPIGQRFGTFTWQSSQSDDVVAEIAEFAYDDDARLFAIRPQRPGSTSEVSDGQLWKTGGTWHWRIWSISRSGDIVFSETRTFPN